MKSDRFLNFAMAIFITLAGTEIGARVLYAQNDIIDLPVISDLLPENSSHIDPYEMQDPLRHRHWRLKPGYVERSQVIAEHKKNAGKLLGASAFSEDGELRINSAGFRGPELSNKQVRSKILMVGDSVTFGLAHTSYPNEVSKLLSKKSSSFEIINAGVEGYRIKNHLYEIGRYKALQPSVVTIMLGWNEIFSITSVVSTLEVWWRTAWLFRFAKEKLSQTRKWLGDEQARSLKLERDRIHPDPTDKAIEIVTRHANFHMPQLINFIDAMQASNSKIALITLPGIFADKEDMIDQSFHKAHLPAFTNNPYVLLALTERFNARLKELAIKRDLTLIDLAEWSKQSLKPRHEFFYDSVHLRPDGLKLIAHYIAEQLIENGLIETNR